MGLAPSSRGFLEQVIDFQIIAIKSNKSLYNDPEFKKVFQITDVNDFVFGTIYGTIVDKFSTYFNAVYGRAPLLDEMKEITDTVTKRLPDIKKAIYFEE